MDRIRKIQRRERIMKVKLSLKVMLFTAIVAGILIYLLAMPVGAETRMIEKQFTYGSYAPVVVIRNKTLFNYALTMKPDGSTTWKRYTGADNQIFVLLDTGGGRVAVASFNGQRDLTVSKTGCRFDVPESHNYEYIVWKDGQRFELKWYEHVKDATAKDVTGWRFISNYKINGKRVAAAFAGWSVVTIEQINAPEN